MSSVVPSSPDDLTQVARLHAKLFPEARSASLERIVQYYQDTFFDHPWVDASIAPLAAWDEGRLTGFLGVIPRPMLWRGKSIKAAVLHRGIVDPEFATPFTAREILKTFLQGPQDLSVCDSASETARDLWESMGKDAVLASSIDWSMSVRPFGSRAIRLARRGRLRPLVRLGRPLFALGDKLADASGRSGSALQSTVEFRSASFSELLESWKTLTAKRPLTSDPTPDSWAWQMERLLANEARGRFESRVAQDQKGKVHAACAWYVTEERTIEILLLAMRPSRRNAVLEGLFRHAWESGLVEVRGRLDRAILQSSWIRSCRLKQRLWTLVHSADPELSLLFHRGEAMSSGLDFEHWVPYPVAELGSWPG